MILAGGLPLAAIALIARHWQWLFGPLSRNATVIWLCLTLQLANVALPSFFINLVAASVWRELLNRLHVATFARASSRLPIGLK